MKKIISVILVTAMIFMLEFNLLQPVFHGAHVWIEPLLAFAGSAALLFWNGKFFKKKP
ncbi:MAG: hypothetical protein U5N56_12390 [Candidatus Marinimicrobia bacterium]|nr:hypothetical protein [Candidatus Neomarinimicrobiota bacterium]